MGGLVRCDCAPLTSTVSFAIAVSARNRIKAMALLQEESGLQEIVRLVGRDSLSEGDQLKLEVAKSIREDFLQQNAFHDIDTFCSLEKQYKMLDMILGFYDGAGKALERGAYLDELLKLPVREKISRAKEVEEENLAQLDAIREELDRALQEAFRGEEEDFA